MEKERKILDEIYFLQYVSEEGEFCVIGVESKDAGLAMAKELKAKDFSLLTYKLDNQTKYHYSK